MEMSDALMIGRTQQWSGGNDVLGIGIAYGLQCTELTLEGRIKIIAVANESERAFLLINFILYTQQK